MPQSISTLLIRNLDDVFGEGDPHAAAGGCAIIAGPLRAFLRRSLGCRSMPAACRALDVPRRRCSTFGIRP